jgi:hypothetical protein
MEALSDLSSSFARLLRMLVPCSSRRDLMGVVDAVASANSISIMPIPVKQGSET